jgi:hypothetical protein
LYLKEHPYNYRHKSGEQQHRDKALAQGHVAIIRSCATGSRGS